MSRILYVDAIGGAAGDMLLAALIDAGAPLPTVLAAIEAVVPGRFDIATEAVRRAGLGARYLRIEPRARQGGGGGDGEEDGGKAPAVRRFRELSAALDAAALSDGVRHRGRAILERLGSAEARVHAMDLDELQLHELGDDDTLLDFVGISAALAALDVDRIAVGSLPIGAGRMLPGWRSHGPVPVPATVTLELLTGFALREGGTDETVTPTAAAVFAALGTPAEGFPEMHLEAVGYGAGTRDPPDRPNVVRVVLGTPSRPGAIRPDTGPHGPDEGWHDGPGSPLVRELLLLEANLDDLSPELLADAAAALLRAGALDAWIAPVLMKKGRPGQVLAALCQPGAEERVLRAFFVETSTFGVRTTAVRRAELERRSVKVALREGSVRVKVGVLGDRVVSATPEHDDVAEVARRLGRPLREIHEEAAAAARELRFTPIEP
jgi:uncharacterized protein (TIGR00299 family) protein